jgi:hypothetical protein
VRSPRARVPRGFRRQGAFEHVDGGGRFAELARAAPRYLRTHRARLRLLRSSSRG